MDAIKRFMRFVSPEPNTGCWLWIGGLVKLGYAGFWLDGKMVYGHRLSYELHRGPIPNGLQIDHLCRVRSCVNPAHLEAVSQEENIRRGNVGSYNRDKTHCPSGHLLSGDNLYRRKHRSQRECKICRAQSAAIQAAKRKAPCTLSDQ